MTTKNYKLLLIFLQLFYFINSQDRLVFLYTHFRHGARAPTKLNDNFTDLIKEYWDNPGELTGVGERMQYLLGFRNRIRYIKNQNFLSEKFDPHEILIYSTNYNRTLVSCYSQLQGLYPQVDSKGEPLSQGQINNAIPQVDLSNNDIQKEIINLGNYSLPYNMILAPVRMINDNEKKAHIHKLDGCDKKKDEINEQNIKNNIYIAQDVNNFNKKYEDQINKLFNTKNKKYSYKEISDLCGSVLPAYTDSRECSELKNAGFDLDDINNYCWEHHRVKYLYENHGDEGKLLAHADSSKTMQEVLFYMKRRLDADITEINEDENIKDYSRPRMIMLSGHDTSLASNEIFLIYALGLNENETFMTPKFASQLALEVKTKKEGKTSSYSDYKVVGYFNDKEIFNFSADEFIKKVEKNIWSDEQIDEFCGINNNSADYSTDNAKNAYKILMVISIFIAAFFIGTTIYLGYKLSKINKISQIQNNNDVNNNQSNNLTGLIIN